MSTDDRDVLQVLKFELEFLEQGGYGRSPRAPWRRPLIFEDSPTCLNFDDRARPNPCQECLLMQFVPPEHRLNAFPCRDIPLNENRESVDSFYRWGTQEELEDAVRGWLRKTIKRLEEERLAVLAKTGYERVEGQTGAK